MDTHEHGPNQDQLFDPANVEPYRPPQQSGEQTASFDIDSYDPYTETSLTDSQKAEIERQVESGQFTRQQAEERAGLRRPEEAPKTPARTTNHHPGRTIEGTSVLMRGPLSSRTRMFGEIGAGKKQGELEAQADSERAAALEAQQAVETNAGNSTPTPTIENPPQ